MKSKYMHLIRSRPARYYEGAQICYMTNGSELRLADSLAQIRREQKASAAWRLKKGYSDANEYGHIRVRIPA